jgi:hypothetical protein
MGDSGFQVIKHPGFISFWGDNDSPPVKRVNWYSANWREDSIIDYIDWKRRIEKHVTNILKRRIERNTHAEAKD